MNESRNYDGHANHLNTGYVKLPVIYIHFILIYAVKLQNMFEKQSLLNPNCGNSTRFCYFLDSILFELVFIDEYVFSASANLDFPFIHICPILNQDDIAIALVWFF